MKLSKDHQKQWTGKHLVYYEPNNFIKKWKSKTSVRKWPRYIETYIHIYKYSNTGDGVGVQGGSLEVNTFRC